jgi:hypothetical protein
VRSAIPALFSLLLPDLTDCWREYLESFMVDLPLLESVARVWTSTSTNGIGGVGPPFSRAPCRRKFIRDEKPAPARPMLPEFGFVVASRAAQNGFVVQCCVSYLCHRGSSDRSLRDSLHRRSRRLTNSTDPKTGCGSTWKALFLSPCLRTEPPRFLGALFVSAIHIFSQPMPPGVIV